MNLTRLALPFLFFFAAFLAASLVQAANSAVILMYHRFGEDAYPSTSIRLEQFEEHLEELTKGPYTVLPVPEIMEKLRKGQSLPERTIGITIDDAYLSVYRQAWPRFRRANLPFSLFVATDPIDNRSQSYMSWRQIRELQRDGVTIGSQTASHLRMVNAERGENVADLAKSNERFEEMLGKKPVLFAYPYGEYSPEVKDLIRESGFEAAFGQHSGAIFTGSDFYALPRFALNEEFGGLDRFKLAVNSLALPVKDVLPTDTVLGSKTNPPAFGFTVDKSITNLDTLSCFASGQGKAQIDILGETRVEVRVNEPFPKGRARINCTKPASDNRWYWFGQQFIIK